MPENTISVRVYHQYFNCDTGCCGHTFEITLPSGEARGEFEFTHPHGDHVKTWAREEAESIIRQHWPDCIDSIDWDSLDVEDVQDNC